ncbi:MAG: flagellar hook-basal body complex protein FliE [Armatimonadetes bacterium]|nr:flagellar hook-basal body complex protein FliE [Armatimonadota bacterium]
MQFNPVSSSSAFIGSRFDGSIPLSGQKPSFTERFEGYVNQVNDLQVRADSAASKLALGDVRSMHAVMIASEEASLALSTVMQVRNKALEAYQEVMRMQV